MRRFNERLTMKSMIELNSFLSSTMVDISDLLRKILSVNAD